MKKHLYLGIDQGSSSTKGLLLDEEANPIEEWVVPVPPPEVNERCVEQDPEALFLSVVEIFDRAIEKAAALEGTIAAAGLAVQRSGVLAWSATDGASVHPVITWADTRTYPQIQALGRGVELISNQTGIPTIPNFAAPKIHLLQREFLEPSIHVGTLDSFLVSRLSEGRVFVTEDTMASRSMLYNLGERAWSDELSRQFKVDKKRLARINPSLAPHTTYRGVSIAALLGDQQAALVGRISVGDRPLLNLGTIASLTRNTGTTPIRKPALKTTVLYSRLIPNAGARDFVYLTEVTSSVTGSVLREPVRRKWCDGIDALQALCESAYEANPVGLATAYFVNNEVSTQQTARDLWPSGVPNVMVCKPEATTSDRARAVVENVGNLIVRMLEEFSEKDLLGEKFPAEIDIAGGGSELDYLMQYIADVSGHTLRRFAAREAGARGAALAAMISARGKGEFRDYNTEPPERLFVCERPERRKRYLMWQRLEHDVLHNTLPAHAQVEA